MAPWLDRYGLGKYAEAFAANDVGADVLPYLTEAHLKELGVSLGDRIRIVRALHAEFAAEPTPPEPEAVPAAATAGEAERRQLTVMFCDLVGSTALSGRLDPEDMQEVLRGYQNAVAGVIRGYDGFVAKYMGDGVLIYFGYPQAHEDDAGRAVRAGLDTVEAMASLNADIGKRHKVELAVRVGIATGPVVVGDIVGEGAAEEAAVVGETPNLAARLQEVASRNQVALANSTRRLLGDAFEYDDLGLRQMKGISRPVQVWHVLRERVLDDDVDTAPTHTALVGRQEELGLLLRSWETSKQGRGQAVLLQGEAGIGKSRLVDALRHHIAGEDYLWVAIRCSPYHANSALWPVIEHMKRAFGWTPDDDADTRLARLERAVTAQGISAAEVVPLFATLMSLPLPEGRYPPLPAGAQKVRELILDALTSWLFDEAERHPVLQVWEDVHWADPTTLELLQLYTEQSQTLAMLNLVTYRPGFVPPWVNRSHVTPITLNRLERAEVEALAVARAGGRRMPDEVVSHIVDKADGVPLYVEELTKTILESGYLREEADRYELVGSLADMAIPASLQDSLMARLDRAPSLREVAQMGAVLGREFAYEMLHAIAGLAEPALRSGLEQLVADELLYQRGRLPRARYIFKHALIQDAAYRSLLKRTRQRHHRRIADLLEQRLADAADGHPELVAHHYTEAGEPARAVPFWREAGERARAQSANAEAIAYLNKGIECLQALPDSAERSRRELALQLSLGHANIVARGHGSVGSEVAYARALALCEQLGDAPELPTTLFGLWRFYVGARPLPETNEIATRIRHLAERKQDTALRVVADYATGFTALGLGELERAQRHLESGLERYAPEQRSAETYRAAQDPAVACTGYLAMVEWLRGYPERALQRLRQSVEHAERIDDKFSLAYALCFPSPIVRHACGLDVDVGDGIELAKANGYSLWIGTGTVQQAASRFAAAPSPAGLADLRDRLADLTTLGVQMTIPYLLSLLADACLRTGHAGEGLRVLDDAQQRIDARSENWWQAEVHRLRGELLLARQPRDADAAAACFERAFETAHAQGARSLQLRATMSLARLGGAPATERLRECRAWFSEGLDTADLRAADALLRQPA